MLHSVDKALTHLYLVHNVCTSGHRLTSAPSHCCYNTWHSQGKFQFHNHRTRRQLKTLWTGHSSPTPQRDCLREFLNPPTLGKSRLTSESSSPCILDSPLVHKTHIECTLPSRSKIQYTCSLHLVNKQLTWLSFPKWKLFIKHVIYLEASLGMSKYIMLMHPP